MFITQKIEKIAFQGNLGAYSDLACREMFPDTQTLPCATFEAAFAAVEEKRADLAMIPIDNTLAGRVADVHHLLPQSKLYIVGEHYLPIHHNLVGLPGADIKTIKTIYSHVHAIPQCRKLLKELGASAEVRADTAGASKDVKAAQDPSIAALSSKLAAEIYGLEILKENVQDEDHNTTRFVVLARDPLDVTPDMKNLKTSFVFQVRNIPAALYKAMGGFATNNVQMTKLESYVGANFEVAFFYAEIEGEPNEPAVKLALEELSFFAKEMRILGTYEAQNL